MQAKISRVVGALRDALSATVVDELGVELGQSERLRVVTPSRLAMALTVSLAGGKCESIADILREFNLLFDTATRYKAFYNRLARASFPLFMQELVCRLLGSLAIRTLQPSADSPLQAFEDIIIQDGSSFGVKDALQPVFPGRFKQNGPAAVELHASYSGFEDQVFAIGLTADKEPERPFLPEPQQLRAKLLLADRGYPSGDYFRQVQRQGGSFIMRVSKTFDPWVLAEYKHNRRCARRRPQRLSSVLGAQHRGRPREFEVKFRDKDSEVFRLIVFSGKEAPGTRLVTNLARTPFDTTFVAKLYRFRWQIELVFKEWKSYANLHAFDTANAHIAEGLIWASLMVAILKRFFAHATQAVHAVPTSTRRVSMCIAPWLRQLCKCLVANHPRRLALVVIEMLAYLAANAPRAHPQRDRLTGRLATGLEPSFALEFA